MCKQNSRKFVRSAILWGVSEKIDIRLDIKQFYQMLPADFTKQDAIKTAEVLGVSVKTIEVWLQKYIQSSHIERVMHGT